MPNSAGQPRVPSGGRRAAGARQPAAPPDLAARFFPYDADASPAIYLDNAATSWPKPLPVLDAVRDHSAVRGSPSRDDDVDLADRCRHAVARFLHLPDPSRLSLVPWCTDAIRHAILALPWRPGDGIVISALEHRAVAEPAALLARDRGVLPHVSPYRPDRPFELDWLDAVLGRNRVRLVAVTAASNVTGQRLPIVDITRLAHRRDALVLVDAAQAAGTLPPEAVFPGGPDGNEDTRPDILAFAGHKGLFGPLGIAGLYTRPGLELPSTAALGAPTPPAIAGLAAAIAWLGSIDLNTRRADAAACAQRLRTDLGRLPGFRVLGESSSTPGPCAESHAPVLAITHRTLDPQTLAARFANAGIAVKAGTHNAPIAHETLGTRDPNTPLGGGALRLSPGFFTTIEDVEEVTGFARALPRG